MIKKLSAVVEYVLSIDRTFSMKQLVIFAISEKKIPKKKIHI